MKRSTRAQEERSTAFTENMEAIKAESEDSTSRVLETQKGHLAKSEELRDKINDLYSVITDTSTAGAFHDESKEEGGTADHWRLITVGCAAVVGLIAIVAVVLSAVTDPSPSLLFSKAAATLAFGAIAVYAGKQSSHHRRRSNDAKDLELELIAVEGFLQSVPTGEQPALRQGYFDRAFRGRSDSEIKRETTPPEFGLSPDAMSAVAQLVRTLQNQQQ